MKAYWHTKTLFIEWWKYKWAKEHNNCVLCGRCDFPHKGKWLCTKCYDKERLKNPARKKQIAKNNRNWLVNNREEIQEKRKQAKKLYYNIYKEELNFIAKWKRYKKAWKQVIHIWKFPLPVWPEKPRSILHSTYNEWKSYDTLLTSTMRYIHRTERKRNIFLKSSHVKK